MIGKAVKGALRWMVLAKGVSQAISWLATIVVIRILTPADYGLFAMAAMLVILAEMLKEIGLGSALVQARELNAQILSQVYTLILIVNILLYAVIVLSAPLVARVFEEPALELLVPVLALQFVVMAFETVPEAMLSRDMDFRSKAIIATAGAIVHSAATLTLALLGFGVWALVFGALVAALSRVIAYSFVQPIYYQPTLRLEGILGMAAFGGYVTLSRFLNVLIVQSSFFVVGRILGKEALGVFSVATQLATLPMQKISGILNEIGLAAFARIQDDRQLIADYYRRAMSILAFISFPVFWGIASVAERLTSLLLGEKWLAIVVPLQLIALVTPLRMIFNTTTPALLGIGRADVFFFNLVILNIVMPVAVYGGMPWGVEGAAFAWLLVYPPLFLYVQRRSLNVLGVRPADLVDGVWRSCVIALVMLVLVLAIAFWPAAENVSAATVLGFQVVFGAAVYATASWVFNRAAFNDTFRLVLSRQD